MSPTEQSEPASPSIADVVTAAQQQQEPQRAPPAHTGSSVFDATTGGGPGSTTGGGRPRLPSSASVDHFGFLHRNPDEDIYVFDEPPEVRVLGGRSQESWPSRYVEYDVEVRANVFESRFPVD